jgi:prolyl oligopeptidase
MTLRLCFALMLMTLLHSSAFAAPLDYPEARRDDAVADDFFGTMVPDPYRWMEDVGSPEVRDWWARQNELTFGYLGAIPGRERMLQRMKSLVDYRRWTAPAHRAGRYFYFRNEGLQNQTPLLMTDDLSAEGHVILDPNMFSTDSSVSLGGWEPSDDGRLLWFSKSSSGSDWNTLHFLNVDTGEQFADEIKWAKFGMATWAADATGIYYVRFPEPGSDNQYTGQNLNPAVWYHALGTDQSADAQLFSLPDHPDWWLSSGVNEERDLMTYYVSEPGSINNRLYFQRLDEPVAPVIRQFDAGDGSYGLVTNIGDRLLIQTDNGAPNGRLIAVTLGDLDPSNWETVIPEQPEPLGWVSHVGDFLYVSYTKDTRTRVRKYSLAGEFIADVKLPGDGYASGFGGRKDDTHTFFTYMDFTTPSTVYRYDIATDTSTVWRAPDIAVDTARYESRLYFYRSFDGTAVPIYVLSKRGLQLDGTNPTILNGYGGFGNGQSPYFSTSRLVWLDMGGVYAIAGIRGGGEYGKQWHEAAIKQNRQVSFNDFIAAAEWLVDSGYTSPERLAINGGSNGGLLVTAVQLQRPDLFSVVLAQVPVTDMLRFNQFTSGKSWESDFGSPQVKDEFTSIFRYSPLHNIKPGACYPATLITTGDTDDRVVPAHSFKFAAALQAAQGCEQPVLLRVETAAGHGAGKPLDKSLAEIADIYAFTLHNFGLGVPEAFE